MLICVTAGRGVSGGRAHQRAQCDITLGLETLGLEGPASCGKVVTPHVAHRHPLSGIKLAPRLRRTGVSEQEIHSGSRVRTEGGGTVHWQCFGNELRASNVNKRF